MSWIAEEIKDAVNKVVAKAEKNATFREQVLADVRGAVKDVTGKEVPEDFKINVVDGTGYHANIVLPEAKESEDELSEADMEMVAGGSKEEAEDFFGTFPEGFKYTFTNPVTETIDKF